MEPLSSFLAKPTLEVLGEPLAASAFRHLARRCERLVANLHRHADTVAETLAALAEASGRPLAFSREKVLLGGAGGVARARSLLGDGPVLVANTDVCAALDLEPLVAAETEEDAVLAVIPHPDPRRWSAVELAEDGRVARFVPAGGEPGRAYLFTGFQRLGAEVVATLPPPPCEFATVWEALRRRGRLRAVVVSGRWAEAGTPLAYWELVMDLLGADSWCHPTSRVAPSATLHRAAVGAGCEVAAASRLEGCVVTGGARVAGGCTLHHCVVAGRVQVPPGTTSRGSLLLPTGTFPLGA